jgi:hypothetical protein
MVARLLYRLVSLFFLLASIVCFGIGIIGIVLQITAHGPDLILIAETVWAFVMGPILMRSSREAWRAVRYHDAAYY